MLILRKLFARRDKMPSDSEKDGDKYIQKVVIDSCIGHKLNGSPDYVKDKQFKQLTSRRYEKK